MLDSLNIWVSSWLSFVLRHWWECWLPTIRNDNIFDKRRSLFLSWNEVKISGTNCFQDRLSATTPATPPTSNVPRQKAEEKENWWQYKQAFFFVLLILLVWVALSFLPYSFLSYKGLMRPVLNVTEQTACVCTNFVRQRGEDLIYDGSQLVANSSRTPSSLLG